MLLPVVQQSCMCGVLSWQAMLAVPAPGRPQEQGVSCFHPSVATTCSCTPPFCSCGKAACSCLLVAQWRESWRILGRMVAGSGLLLPGHFILPGVEKCPGRMLGESRLHGFSRLWQLVLVLLCDLLMTHGEGVQSVLILCNPSKENQLVKFSVLWEITVRPWRKRRETRAAAASRLECLVFRYNLTVWVFSFWRGFN